MLYEDKELRQFLQKLISCVLSNGLTFRQTLRTIQRFSAIVMWLPTLRHVHLYCTSIKIPRNPFVHSGQELLKDSPWCRCKRIGLLLCPASLQQLPGGDLRMGLPHRRHPQLLPATGIYHVSLFLPFLMQLLLLLWMISCFILSFLLQGFMSWRQQIMSISYLLWISYQRSLHLDWELSRDSLA